MFEFIIQQAMLAVYHVITAAVYVLQYASEHSGVFGATALVCFCIAIPLLIAMWFEGVFDK